MWRHGPVCIQGVYLFCLHRFIFPPIPCLPCRCGQSLFEDGRGAYCDCLPELKGVLPLDLPYLIDEGERILLQILCKKIRFEVFFLSVLGSV